MTIWVVLSVDEASVVGVTTTAEQGKALALADLGPDQRPLIWEERRDGRFRSTSWDYEVRPFEVIA